MQILPEDSNAMELVPRTLSVGQLANEYVAKNAFNDYQEKLAGSSLKRHKDDIKLFSDFLKQVGMQKDNLLYDPAEWQDITFGLVETFKRWQLEQGYAIASINAHLSTVKVYAKLVMKAGVFTQQEYALIKSVEGYSHKEGRNVDEKRKVRDVKTRLGDKKAEAVSLTQEQAKQLKNQPDTPQGRRDAFLMCLLLDHGLRCGEVAALTPSSLNMTEGKLIFYRQKVDKTQTHKLTGDTLLAAMNYLKICKPIGSLLMGSRKGGKLEGRMSERAITDRVRVLGEAIGVEGLSAHDCRHDWAKSAVKESDIKSLQQAGGWSSPAMPLRYADDAKIANEGIKLSR
jgi:integrase